MTATTELSAGELIIAAALAYNAEYLAGDPVDTALVGSGTPTVDVRYATHGLGWAVSVSVTLGVRLSTGEFAAAGAPATFGPIRILRGRTLLDTAEWATTKAAMLPAGIPVEYRRAGADGPPARVVVVTSA